MRPDQSLRTSPAIAWICFSLQVGSFPANHLTASVVGRRLAERWEQLLRGAITPAFQQGMSCPDKMQVLFFLLPSQPRRLIPPTLDGVNLCSQLGGEESPGGQNSV